MFNPLKWQLHTQILIGLVLGVVAGIIIGPSATVIRPVGTLFIRLITMIVVPIVLSSIVVGTASLGDIRKLGRIGLKTIIYFLVTTALAVALGIFLTDIVGPGRHLDPATKNLLLANYRGAVTEKIQNLTAGKPNVVDMLINLVPGNPFEALAKGDMLQIIFFSIFLGIALTFLPDEKRFPLIRFFDGISDAMVQIVHIVMKMAPLGVFALIAAITGEFGLKILLTLFQYSAVVFSGLSIFLLVAYPVALKLFTPMSAVEFFRGMKDAMIVAFSTSSSNATLPVNIECVTENLGVPRDIASFVLPLGATVNMNGTALYQGVAAVFLAQVYGIDLSLSEQLMIVLTATLAAIGTSGVPGAGIVMLTIVLQSIGIPLEGIALILGVDRILDMCRTVLNITGDASCAVIVAATEKSLRESGSRRV